MTRKTIGLILAAAAAATAVQAGLFDGWAYNAKLSFSGYGRAETLSNFPFLVTLADGSNGFHYADLASPADGSDLRFSSANGAVELPYEIEKWDTDGVSVVWVRASQITGVSDTAWAYWGKAGAGSPSAASNVWADGFKAVWHMNATNAAGLVPDSSALGASGVASNITNAAGRIAGAFGFNGNNSLINCGNPAEFNGMTSLTMEAWVRIPRTNMLTTQRTLMRKDRVFGLDAGSDAPGHKARGLFFKSGSANWTIPGGTTWIDDGKWHHVAAVYDGSYARLYVNGKQEGAVALTGALTTSNNNLYIGWTTAGTVAWDGVIDEVRLAQPARSSNWVWAAWMNAASNSSFVSVRPGVPAIANTAASNVLDTSADLGGQLTMTGGSPATVWLFLDTVDRGQSKTWQFATNLGVRAPGDLNTFLSGLESNRDYVYTYYASNATEEAWGDAPVAFKTWGPPRVDNGVGAQSVGYTSAVLTGRLLDGIAADARFEWGQDPGTLTNVMPLGAVAEGTFTASLAGLQNDAVFYYRAYASNAYGEAWAPVTNFSTIVLGLSWTGGGTNNLASNSNNWQNGVRPVSGDSVHLDAMSVKALTWDLSNVVLRAWNQDESYTGTVTILTRYPGQGAFTNMAVTGTVRILGGTWTHPVNTGVDTASDCLRLTVGGDLILGSNAQINAERKGYASGKGPGAGSGSSIIQSSCGASHGGMGGQGGTFTMPAAPYGSPFEPVALGSSTYIVGGGSVKLTVAGTTRLDGLMTVQADQFTTNRQGGAAGGSLFLVTGRLEGNGVMTAVGGRGGLDQGTAGSGGGGRIAVHLTASDAFGNVSLRARGGSSAYLAAAGTVYLQTAGQAPGEGRLIIDNGGGVTTWAVCTAMPEPSAYNGTTDLTRLSEIVVTNKGILGIAPRTAFDFGSGNLRTHGKTNSTVAILGTNNLAFPGRFEIAGFTLSLLSPVSAKGDWVVASSGLVMHPINNTAETFRVDLTLDGNLTVEAGGAVDVNEKGYRASAGPASGTTSAYGSPGAGHGGQGGWGGTSGQLTTAPKATYGSVTAPASYGSGAAYPGSGVMLLRVSGTTTVDGALSACQIPNQSLTGSAGSSGGSILIRTGFLRGTGTVDVSGGPSMGQGNAGSPNGSGGGGGRLSVVLTAGGDFGQVRLFAAGGTNLYSAGIYSGAAGTLYTETAAQGTRRGRLLIANANRALNPSTNAVTLLPAPTNAVAGELEHVTVVLSNRAYAALSSDLKIGDLFILTNTPNFLFLRGYTLTIEARRHADWAGPNDVVYDGGQIIWGSRQGTLILIR